MIISDSHKFIFLHPQRTGGSSIEWALAPYSKYVVMVGNHTAWGTTTNQFQSTTMNEAKALIAQGKLKEFEKHWGVKEVQKRFPNIFENYLKFAIVRNPWDRAVSLWSTKLRKDKLPIIKENYINLNLQELESIGSHGRGCSHYTHINGKLAVDFIIRYENIEKDFAKVCEKLGINTFLPVIGKSEDRLPYSYYLTAESEARIAEW